ncbi:unnamed protein product [Trichogramma brassicae]|uniref:Uncharacterized protein n=1 Tax=Trichogramma brassicae TaxID=86971 RepID=A0A6H5J2M5_9HYME|nr:unnamed protein product [Trichogramma brassicae]
MFATETRHLRPDSETENPQTPSSAEWKNSNFGWRVIRPLRRRRHQDLGTKKGKYP